MITRRTGATLLLAALLTATGACSVPATGGGTVTPAAPSATPAAPQETPGPAPEQSGVATFGQRYTWPSGVAVEVKTPEKFTPSRSAAGNTQGRAVVVTTTVINGSDQPYEVNPFIIGPKVTHAGAPADTITDLEKKIGVVASSTILPGKSFTYKTAYSIGASTGEMQLEYQEDFGSGPGIFVGDV